MMKRFLVAPLLLLLPFLTPAQNKIAERPIGQTCYNAGGTGGCLAFSATPSFDAGITKSFKITLTANVTSSTITGMEAGQELTFEVCQDGVGSRTFAWPALTVGPIAVLSGANVCTVETFHYDGTSAYIWTTTTSGGGGSGTINAGIGGHFPYYGANGTTLSNNANLDDGILNALALTYSGANGIFAAQFNSTTAGALVMGGAEGTPSGAAVGKDVLSCGDLTSHSCQVSNNGDSFRSIATHNSTSPVVGGVMVAGTFPQMIASSRGAFGQPFLEGSGNPGFGQLDLSLSTSVVNRLPKLNQTSSTIYNDQVNAFTAAGTLDLSASTVASAFRLPNLAGCTVIVNGAQCYDTTNNMAHLGMNGADSRLVATTITPTDTFCMQWAKTSGHYEAGMASGPCGTPGGAGALSGITAAVAGNTINNGDFAQIWNANLTTAGRHWFTFTENSASTCTGLCYLHDIHTIASSTARPLIVTAGGTANGIEVDTTGTVKKLGTGGVDGAAISGVIPIVNGGLNNNAVPSSDGQIPIWNASLTKYVPGDPITSGNQAAATTQTITATGALTGVTVTGIGTVLVTVSGTYAGVAFNFEATPDGTFSPAFSVSATQLDAASIVSASGTLGANTTRSWLVDAAGFTKVRLNATAYTSGTANVTITPVYHQFIPWTNANITNIPHVVADSLAGNVAVTQADGADVTLGAKADAKSTATDTTAITVMQVLKEISAMAQAPAALPANQSTNQAQIGGSAVVADPCQQLARTNQTITTTAGVQLIAGTSAKQTYICSMDIITATAQNIALVEGTGTVCATGIAGMAGGTTAATGWNFSANGGFVKGTGGNWVFRTATNADNVCLLLSGSGQTSGSIQYVQQ